MFQAYILRFIVVVVILPKQFDCERIESVNLPGNGDSCNVVNVHFGSITSDGIQDSPARVAAPGKRGPVGPEGPIGPQGSKGRIGQKGEPGVMVKKEEIRNDVIAMLSAASCEELNQKYGVIGSGYFLLNASPLSLKSPFYHYCDFNVFEGVSNCNDLATVYNKTKHGTYRLREESKNTVFHYCPDPLTCHELFLRDGPKESGLYHLGHEGDTFEVYCNFFTGEAVTEVWHDSMEETQIQSSCEDPGCYSRIPQYTLNLRNIIKIIKNSRECRQYIKFKCQGVVLAHVNNPHGWWVSREGEKMLYWGDVLSKRPYFCACGDTGSCVVKEQKCNCDNNGNEVTQDEGYLTDKTKLPVREMKFGDLSGSEERGWHTLGKLQCMGQSGE